jgi:hypothetical protein
MLIAKLVADPILSNLNTLNNVSGLYELLIVQLYFLTPLSYYFTGTTTSIFF